MLYINNLKRVWRWECYWCIAKCMRTGFAHSWKATREMIGCVSNRLVSDLFYWLFSDNRLSSTKILMYSQLLWVYVVQIISFSQIMGTHVSYPSFFTQWNAVELSTFCLVAISSVVMRGFPFTKVITTSTSISNGRLERGWPFRVKSLLQHLSNHFITIGKIEALSKYTAELLLVQSQ